MRVKRIVNRRELPLGVKLAEPLFRGGQRGKQLFQPAVDHADFTPPLLNAAAQLGRIVFGGKPDFRQCSRLLFLQRNRREVDAGGILPDHPALHPGEFFRLPELPLGTGAEVDVNSLFTQFIEHRAVEFAPHFQRLQPLGKRVQFAGKLVALVEQRAGAFDRLGAGAALARRRNFAVILFEELVQLADDTAAGVELLLQLLGAVGSSDPELLDLHHAERAQRDQRGILFGFQRQQRDFFHRYNHSCRFSRCYGRICPLPRTRYL